MSLLVSALICVFHVNVISCHSVFTNVAYSKPVTLSSVYSGHHGYFPGPNAVNGLLSDFVHTFNEKFPWLRIDLGARYRIHEIELFSRSGCCGRYKVFPYICSWYLLLENLLDYLFRRTRSLHVYKVHCIDSKCKVFF